MVTAKGSSKFKVGDEVTLDVVEAENRKLAKTKTPAQYVAEPFFLSAIEEDRAIIAQANAPIDSKSGKFERDRVHGARRWRVQARPCG